MENIFNHSSGVSGGEEAEKWCASPFNFAEKDLDVRSIILMKYTHAERSVETGVA